MPKFFPGAAAAISEWRKTGQQRALTRKGYVPPESVEIPQTGAVFVIRTQGVRPESTEGYLDGKLIYHKISVPESGTVSQIVITAADGTNYDYGNLGYDASDITVTYPDGRQETGYKKTTYGDSKYRNNHLFEAFDSEFKRMLELQKTSASIFIKKPNDRDLYSAKLRGHGWVKVSRYEAVPA